MASDAIINGEWFWLKSQQLMTFTDWAPGEPDQTIGRDCLGLWGNQSYKYGAWDCKHELKPICEIE